MKTSRAAMLLTLVATLAWSADTPANLLARSELPSPLTDPLTVTSHSPEHTVISMINPAFRVEEVVTELGSGQVSALEGGSLRLEEGRPVLPHVTRLYRIPDRGAVSLAVRTAEFELVEDYDAAPFYDEELGSPAGYRDPEVYDRDEWYPQVVAEISGPKIFRDFRVVSVTLNPIQVNPVTRQARLYHNLELEIVAESEPGVNELVHVRQPSRAFAPMYGKYIRNLDERALDDVSATPGTYAILAGDNPTVQAVVDSLAQWKRRKGFEVTVESRGHWNSEQVNAYLQTLYAESDPPLEYVCLMGDPRAGFGLPVDSGSQYDHGYALLAGNDEIQDVAIGRLSGATAAEMMTIWTKIALYERDPLVDVSHWFNWSLLYATTNFSQPANCLTVEWIHRHLTDYTAIDTSIIRCVNHQSDPIEIRDWFNRGVGLFVFSSYWLAQIDPTIPGTFSNGGRLPVCVIMAEGTGNYEWDLAVSEAFVIAGTPLNPKGAVAAIGYATATGWAAFLRAFTGGFVEGMGRLGLEHVGVGLVAGKLRLAETFGSLHEGYLWRIPFLNLIGDPALSMWTDTPRYLTIIHPSPMAVGQRQISVTVADYETEEPVADALVVACVERDHFTRVLTDSSGVAVLPVDVPSPNTIQLTVTKHNCVPYLVDIPCEVAALHVAIDTVTIDDENADGHLSPGESADVNIELTNNGTSVTAQNVSAQLTSRNDHIELITDQISYPDLPPDGSAFGDGPFRIRVSPEMRHGEQATLQLAVSMQDTTIESAFEVVCTAGRVDYDDHELLGPLEPGLSVDFGVRIGNSGGLDMPESAARLESLSPYLRVDQPHSGFDPLQIGQTAWCTAPFGVTADSVSYPGHVAAMRLIVETNEGYVDTTHFELVVGALTENDPSGPDAYGYFAYDNGDEDYDHCPEFVWVDIAFGLGVNLNLDDPGEKISADEIYSVVRDLPFPFRYYGETYDRVTICSNGWLAFGEFNRSDEFFDMPMPAILAPGPLVAAYWDDLRTNATGQGVWEYDDTALHRYVAQWNAGGGQGYDDADLEFQIILLDPAEYQSEDGEGKILLQYHDAVMNLSSPEWNDPPGCTIGIQSYDQYSALQYARGVTYAPGAAEVADGRAILFTTDGPPPPSSPTGSPPPALPSRVALHQNHPNPFNATTTLTFDLPRNGSVSLRIYDVTGRAVRNLADGFYEAGTHQLLFDASGLASGVYFCRLEAAGHARHRKVVLLK